MCGDQVFFLALTWAAIQVGTPAEVGAVIAAASLPRLLLLLIGGTLADRVNPQLLAALTDLGRVAALATTVVVVLVLDLQIWHLVVIGVLVGALDSFFAPAIGALPASIVPAESLGRVGGMRTVVQRVALLLAGPIAGGTIAWAGSAAGFATAAALFALSAFLLLLLGRSRPRPTPDATARAEDEGRAGAEMTTGEPGLPLGSGPSTIAGPGSPSFLSDLIGGLAVVRQHPVVLWTLVLAAALNLGFSGPITAGLPLLSAQQGWGAAGAGLLIGAFGLGAAVTGLTIAFLHHVPRAGSMMLIALAIEGLAIAGFAAATSLAMALMIAAVLGLGAGVVGSIVHGALLTVTPPASLGRVMGFLALTLEGAFPISNFLTGVVTQVYGVDLAFVVGGGLLVLTAAGAGTRRALRTLDLRRSAPSLRS